LRERAGKRGRARQNSSKRLVAIRIRREENLATLFSKKTTITLSYSWGRGGGGGGVRSVCDQKENAIAEIKWGAQTPVLVESFRKG